MFSEKSTQSSCINSRLVPDLFSDNFVEVGTVRVLELGPAQGDTVGFLNQFNCRLKVLDIVEEIKRIDAEFQEEDDPDTAKLEADLVRALNLGPSDVFDVCLFWDSLNYLSPAVLKAFSRSLVPHLSERFRGHGFAVLNKNSDLYEQRYGIINRELLSVGGLKKKQLPYRHSQAVIMDVMEGLAIKQSILREDGRLEMVLTLK